ncbi:glutathione S-transferase family protein [Roseibium aestuarii]|uniref:Glutathione S-transferase family protein n=1 Tax=Roseibium aestuarii TaxID=2600299 RepID=A0ABW4K0D3_9HYPH|nr:glutathione S-transferase family protein [Roseibium aestuarii]
MPAERYRIVGHRLCPYVQRVVITMLVKGMAFDRIDIDLDAKPDWLPDISPGGKVPVLEVLPGIWLFESGVIAKYLDSISGGGLLPSEPLPRAQYEAWLSYIDGLLSIVARVIYRDEGQAAVQRSLGELRASLPILAERISSSGYLAADSFGLLDAVLATLFRYFPVLSQLPGGEGLTSLPDMLAGWWERVKLLPFVQAAVPGTYEQELISLIAAQTGYAGRAFRAGSVS